MASEAPADDPMGARYRFQCYQEKNTESCHQLGVYLITYMNEAIKARKVFKMNCSQNNYQESCFKLANMNFLGKGGEKNVEEAATLYEKLCRDNDANSCHVLGMIYQGEEAKKDLKKAALYYDKGCEIGCSKSCQKVSAMYITGEEGGVPKNMKKAFRFAKKGCSMGDPYACGNLSIMYGRGEGVNKDESIAQQIQKNVKELQKDAKEMKSSSQEERSARLKLFRESMTKLLD